MRGEAPSRHQSRRSLVLNSIPELADLRVDTRCFSHCDLGNRERTLHYARLRQIRPVDPALDNDVADILTRPNDTHDLVRLTALWTLSE